MSKPQTTEEKELVAKWNAGDYSAEGWVANTDGLSEGALKGLAQYNTKKYFAADNFDEEVLLNASKADAATLIPDLPPGSVGNATMRIMTISAGPVPAVIAEVLHDFAPGFGRFRAVLYGREPGAGSGTVSGLVGWIPDDTVSSAPGPAILRQGLPGILSQVSLSAATSGSSPSPRLQFTGPSGNIHFTDPFKGFGRYMP